MKDGTKIRRWSCGKATNAGKVACDIGRLVRDDEAMQMLKIAIKSIPIDYDWIIKNVTELAVKAIEMGIIDKRNTIYRLKKEMEFVQLKKAAMMDSYFAKEITKEDMIAFKRNYNLKLEELQQRFEDASRKAFDVEKMTSQIMEDISDILKGDIESEVFYKNMLESMTVFQDRRIELHLKYLPQVFWFSG